MVTVERADVLRFRFARHGLDRPPASVGEVGEVALLDYGVQDTGPDGARWALAARGADTVDAEGLALVWTLRGAPHAYRRRDLSAVAVATSPLSAADAAKRIFDAAKALKAAGIDVLDALAVVADHLRELAAEPVPKGEASSRLTEVLDDAYLRQCRPCGATHIYEQPFRLAALQAGLELEPGTSPPVLRRVAGLEPLRFGRSGAEADRRFHVVRNHLRFYGPSRPRDVAAFLDAPVADVKANWPDDAVPVTIAGDLGAGRGTAAALAADVEELAAGRPAGGVVRLVGPYDPYLQLRDRELLVADAGRRTALWPVLGRPGAVLVDGEVLATWRPRRSGRKLSVAVEGWTSLSGPVRRGIDDQVERLAAHRGVALAATSYA